MHPIEQKLRNEIGAAFDAAVTSFGKEQLRQLREIQAKGRTMSQTATHPWKGVEGAPETADVICAALGRNCGKWDDDFIAQEYGANVVDEIYAAGVNRLGVKGVFWQYAQDNNLMEGWEVDEACVGRCLNHATLQASGASTFSLPTVLSDYANKQVLRTFRQIKPQLRRIAKQVQTGNFQPKRMFRVSITKGFEEVGSDGQYPSARLAETSYTAEVKERALKLVLTRRDIANDDMDVFNELSGQFSAEADHAIEEALAKVLIGGIASGFFATAKGNYFSGAGTDLDYDSLVVAEAAFDAFEEKTDDGQTGRMRSVEPSFVVTAPTGHVVARQLYRSTNLAFMSANREGEANVFHELYEPVKAKYMGNGKVTGANGTQWMLTADPQFTSPIVLASLDGKLEPKVHQWSRLPGQSGAQWDVTLDFDCGLHDATAAVMFEGLPAA